MKRPSFLKIFEKALLGHISEGLCSSYCSLGCLLSFHKGKEEENGCSCVCSIAVISQLRNFVRSVMLRWFGQFCKAVILLKLLLAFSVLFKRLKVYFKEFLKSVVLKSVSFSISLYFSVVCLIFDFCMSLPLSKVVQGLNLK